jgi:hypothetical protein
MKKYARSQTKVASRAVFEPASTLKTNPQAAAHRDHKRAYEKHWTAARVKYAHELAFGVSR